MIKGLPARIGPLKSKILIFGVRDGFLSGYAIPRKKSQSQR